MSKSEVCRCQTFPRAKKRPEDHHPLCPERTVSKSDALEWLNTIDEKGPGFVETTRERLIAIREAFKENSILLAQAERDRQYLCQDCRGQQ